MLRVMCLLFCAAPLVYSQAQSSSADLKGTVVDPSGAVVANAELSATDPQTGLTRSTTSDRSGEFLFRLLPPSRYNLKVSAEGFAVKSLESIELRVGDTVTLTI